MSPPLSSPISLFFFSTTRSTHLHWDEIKYHLRNWRSQTGSIFSGNQTRAMHEWLILPLKVPNTLLSWSKPSPMQDRIKDWSRTHQGSEIMHISMYTKSNYCHLTYDSTIAKVIILINIAIVQLFNVVLHTLQRKYYFNNMITLDI